MYKQTNLLLMSLRLLLYYFSILLVNLCCDNVSISSSAISINSTLLSEKSLILTDPVIGTYNNDALVTNDGIVINRNGNTLNVWNYSTQSLVRSFQSSIGFGGSGMVLSQDESFLYAIGGSNGGQIVKWNWKTGENIKTIYTNPSGSISDLIISGDGGFLAFLTFFNGKTQVVLYNLLTNTFKSIEVDFSPVLSISSDGNRICVANTTTKEATIYDSNGFSKIWIYTNLTNFVNCLKMSPDGKYIINGDFFTNNQVRKFQIWNIDLKTKELELNIDGAKITDEITFSDDGLLVTLNGNVFYDFKSKKILYSRNLLTDKIPFAGNFSKNGKYFIASFDSGLELYTLFPIAKVPRTFLNKNQSLFLSGKLSPNGSLLVTSDNYGLKLWDANTGQVQFHDPLITISDFNFSDDLEKIQFRKNAVWFINKGDVYKLNVISKAISKVTNTSNISFLYVSEDESIFGVYNSNANILIYSFNNILLRDFGKPQGNIYTRFKISFDNKYLTVPSTDNVIKVYDINSGGLLKSFSGYTTSSAVNFANTNSDIIAALYEFSKTNILNFKTGEIKNSISSSASISRVFFSPDDKKIAGFSSNLLSILDLSNNTLLKRQTFDDYILSVVFNQTGSQLTVLTQRGLFLINTQ